MRNLVVIFALVYASSTVLQAANIPPLSKLNAVNNSLVTNAANTTSSSKLNALNAWTETNKTKIVPKIDLKILNEPLKRNGTKVFSVSKVKSLNVSTGINGTSIPSNTKLRSLNSTIKTEIKKSALREHSSNFTKNETHNHHDHTYTVGDLIAKEDLINGTYRNVSGQLIGVNALVTFLNVTHVKVENKTWEWKSIFPHFNKTIIKDLENKTKAINGTEIGARRFFGYYFPTYHCRGCRRRWPCNMCNRPRPCNTCNRPRPCNIYNIPRPCSQFQPCSCQKNQLYHTVPTSLMPWWNIVRTQKTLRPEQKNLGTKSVTEKITTITPYTVPPEKTKPTDRQIISVTGKATTENSKIVTKHKSIKETTKAPLKTKEVESPLHVILLPSKQKKPERHHRISVTEKIKVKDGPSENSWVKIVITAKPNKPSKQKILPEKMESKQQPAGKDKLKICLLLKTMEISSKIDDRRQLKTLLSFFFYIKDGTKIDQARRDLWKMFEDYYTKRKDVQMDADLREELLHHILFRYRSSCANYCFGVNTACDMRTLMRKIVLRSFLNFIKSQKVWEKTMELFARFQIDIVNDNDELEIGINSLFEDILKRVDTKSTLYHYCKKYDR